MKKDDVGIFQIEKYLKQYDKDAEKTVAFYNMLKQVVNTEDDNGLQIFSMDLARIIAEKSENFPKGLTTMLSMRDDFGNLRFKKHEDYIAAEVFEKYSEEAQNYANMRDEMGNYRFGGEEIDEIVKAKFGGLIKPNDIDNILNLKRNDGSYVFDKLPDSDEIEHYAEEPELFTEICNIKTPNRNNYVSSNCILALMQQYRHYPEETKKILQMGYNGIDSRFSEHDMIKNNDAPYVYKNAPKAFVSLASLKKGRYNNDGYRFELSDICKIIKSVNNSSEISELSKEDLKAINELSKIRVPDYSSRRDPGLLEADEICK